MFQTKPITGEWLHNCRVHGWTREGKLADSTLEPLKQKLLSLGGTAACIWTEPDFDALMARGQVWDGKDAVYTGGESSRCHEQTAQLWYQRKAGMKLCTGWALSPDGMWRQHSWGLLDGKVIETTPSERSAYYGFVMNDAEASLFASSQ